MKKTFLSLMLFLLVLPFLYPSCSHAATKKALLVGINHYKNLPFYSHRLKRWITNLQGSINDVRIMRELLISRYGFRAEDIKVLTNEEATRESILHYFESRLVRGTREEDLVFFYFSGHGTQIPDQNGDEEDGMDETLCPYDLVPVGAANLKETRAIIDDELGVMFRKVKARDVVVIVDACHSGSMTRSIGGIPVSQLEETPAYYPKYIPVELAESLVRGKSFSSDIPRQNDIPTDQIFISSSRENQLSLEIALDEGFRGAMSSALVEGMTRRRDVTYLELYEYARKVIKDRHRLEQDPQIEPEKGKILETRIFAATSEIVLTIRPESQKPDAPSVKKPSPEPIPQKTKPEAQRPPVVAQSTQPPQAPTSSPAKTGVQKPQTGKPTASPPPATPEKLKPSPQTGSSQQGPQTAAQGPATTEKPSVAPQSPSEVKKRVLLRIEPLQGANSDLTKELEDRIRRLDYVELVHAGYFDRLIRGEAREGELHVRLLNRIGDVEIFQPTSNIGKLTNLIIPRLEYAYIVKQLAHISNPEPPFRVKVWVTDDKRRDFRIGEKVVFYFYSEKDCYLHLFNVDSQGNFHIIFPNRFYRDNSVNGGVKRKIPDESMGKKFEFEFGEPAGEETVKVIATLEPLRLDELGIQGFKQTFDPSGEMTVPSGVRAILVKKIEETLASQEFIWSEDTVVIRSHRAGAR